MCADHSPDQRKRDLSGMHKNQIPLFMYGVRSEQIMGVISHSRNMNTPGVEFLAERYADQRQSSVPDSLANRVYSRNLTLMSDMEADIVTNNSLIRETKRCAALYLPRDLVTLAVDYYAVFPIAKNPSRCVSRMFSSCGILSEKDLVGGAPDLEILRIGCRFTPGVEDDSGSTRDFVWFIGKGPTMAHVANTIMPRDFWAALLLGDVELLLTALKAILSERSAGLGLDPAQLWSEYLPRILAGLQRMRSEMAASTRW